MNKFLSFLGLMIGGILFSQSNLRLMYELTYSMDSLDSEKKQKEFFVLGIEDGKSYFSSENKLKRDSVGAVMEKQFNSGTLKVIDARKIPKTAFSYSIIRENNENKVFQRIDGSNFFYKEKVLSNWKIEPNAEKYTFDGVECQAASIHHSGREFFAWFRADIPVLEGPYIFSGLPGLVVKVQDKKKDYIFQLIQIEKDKNHLINYLNEKDYKEISKKKFYEAIENERANMFQRFKAMGGFEISPQREKEIRDRDKKKNNPLELRP